MKGRCGVKALMIIAYEQFRDEEYLEPKSVLVGNGIDITTASWDLGTAIGKSGIQAEVDITIDEVDTNKYDAIIYIGGPGSKRYWDNLAAHRIAKEGIEYNKVLAAICSASITLARAGVLKDKKATCYKGDVEELKREGAIYTGNPLEQDGLIITADGPGSATSFGIRILETMREVGGSTI